MNPMANSETFDRACALLEELTELSRLEARGTVRLALKQSGLDAASVLASELAVVVQAILPNELDARGVPDAGSICEKLHEDLSGISDSPKADSPESVFSRFGGES
jgi:hypothetical protein